MLQTDSNPKKSQQTKWPTTVKCVFQMFVFNEMEGKQALAIYHQWEQQDYFSWEKQMLNYLKLSAKCCSISKYMEKAVQVDQQHKHQATMYF